MGRGKGERQRRAGWWRLPILIVIVTAAIPMGFWMWRFFSADAATLLRRANACAARDPAEAERLLNKAIAKAGGRFPEAEMALCRIYAERGQWEQALPLFADLDRAACTNEFLLSFGKRVLAASRSAEGVQALTEVRRRRVRDSVPALDLLFSHYREQNDERNMLDCVRELAELDGQPALWWKLLEMLDSRQLDTEYLSTLRVAVQQKLPERDRSEMRHRLVARLVDQGDAAEARRELERVIDREGYSARSNLHLAAICRLEGQPREALELVQAAVADGTERPEVIRLRALIYFDLGMNREAAEDFQRQVDQDPFDLVSHFKLAEAYRNLGMVDSAQRHHDLSLDIRQKRQKINKLREAAGRRPADRPLFEQLADLHRELNDPRGAALWQERAHRIPSSADQQLQPPVAGPVSPP